MEQVQLMQRASLERAVASLRSQGAAARTRELREVAPAGDRSVARELELLRGLLLRQEPPPPEPPLAQEQSLPRVHRQLLEAAAAEAPASSLPSRGRS